MDNQNQVVYIVTQYGCEGDVLDTPYTKVFTDFDDAYKHYTLVSCDIGEYPKMGHIDDKPEDLYRLYKTKKTLKELENKTDYCIDIQDIAEYGDHFLEPRGAVISRCTVQNKKIIQK